MILQNTQVRNPPRRHKNYKHICTQQRSTQIYKEILGGLQERYNKTIIVGDFVTLLSTMDRSSKQYINQEIVELITPETHYIKWT